MTAKWLVSENNPVEGLAAPSLMRLCWYRAQSSPISVTKELKRTCTWGERWPQAQSGRGVPGGCPAGSGTGNNSYDLWLGSSDVHEYHCAFTIQFLIAIVFPCAHFNPLGAWYGFFCTATNQYGWPPRSSSPGSPYNAYNTPSASGTPSLSLGIGHCSMERRKAVVSSRCFFCCNGTFARACTCQSHTQEETTLSYGFHRSRRGGQRIMGHGE